MNCAAKPKSAPGRFQKWARKFALFASVVALAGLFAGRAWSDSPGPDVVHFEAETLPLKEKSFATYKVIGDERARGGALAVLQPNELPAWVTYKVAVPAPGIYDIVLVVKTWNDRGRFQVSVDGTEVGALQEEYSTAPAFEAREIKGVRFATAGDKEFKFTVIGSDRRSLGSTMALDCIELRRDRP